MERGGPGGAGRGRFVHTGVRKPGCGDDGGFGKRRSGEGDLGGPGLGTISGVLPLENVCPPGVFPPKGLGGPGDPSLAVPSNELSLECTVL